jgi:flagellum-specific ATP synthase
MTLEISERISKSLLEKISDSNINPQTQAGKVKRIVGMIVEATGLSIAVGSQCKIKRDGEGDWIDAEVVGFQNDTLLLMPIGLIKGIKPDAQVIVKQSSSKVHVGHGLLGRIVDSTGEPLDGKEAIPRGEFRSITGQQINPLSRLPVSEPLDVGVKTINALLTLGKGQRMGLMAGTGVGKSVLLSMMAKNTKADVVVVGLIGERGREVSDFIQKNLDKESLKKTVVVASPADDPPLKRLNGAKYATTVAEYFRDMGLDVLLLIDSLSRFAQAQREIALSVGEPPVNKGYPPSVFSKLPSLVERAGNKDEGDGSITAIYTVLAEGDDENDVVLDAARGVLDGHIVLSREIASSGIYPAIDVTASISRTMHDSVEDEHFYLSNDFKKVYSHYFKNIDLIRMGAYRSGSDPQIDKAISKIDGMNAFLSQNMNESFSLEESLEELRKATA